MLALVLAVFLALRRLYSFLAHRFARQGRPGGYRRLAECPAAHIRQKAKPAWVREEVIRLKALMLDAGCRAIADCFNRRFAVSRRMTVGKTFVAEVIRSHLYDITCLRREIKNARPRDLPKNLVWALDLTGKTTLEGRTRFVLGILEHASRAALCLEALQRKSSWELVRRLLRAIRRHGKPAFLRTDNESIFASRAFGLALGLLGIRHQRIDPHCPWQNGRMERFFGTLKEKLDRLAVKSLEALDQALVEFRFFYKHVRPHRNLDGRTPAEAWTGVNPYASKAKGEFWFEGWDGLLRGYYLRR